MTLQPQVRAMHPDDLIERELTSGILGAFYEVYNQLGFGFLEFIYALALERELIARGYSVRREVVVDVHYKGELLAQQRVDMLVNEKVLLELKSTAILPAAARRLTLNYLRASTLEVALLLHFGPEPAFHRFVNSRRRRLND